MNLHLKDKVIVVTGGAKGIGEAIAQTLALEGSLVAIVGRNGEDNAAAIEKIAALGGQAFSFVAELTRPEECARAVAEVGTFFGRIDGLVNNAGLNDSVGLATGSYESFVDSLHKNLIHYYLMAHHALPYLKQSRGVIVNIGSKTADTGQGGTSGYAAANGGRNALTREWAVELLPFGIRVNAVIVAECLTELYQTWLDTYPDPAQKLREVTGRIPLGKRMTTVTEVASTVAFLLSRQSSHTTGQLLHVDGGYVHLDRAIS